MGVSGLAKAMTNVLRRVGHAFKSVDARRHSAV
jgi:hypothetical protein